MAFSERSTATRMTDENPGSTSGGRQTALPALPLFGAAIRARPVGALLGLVVEYGMFFSAVLLALGLFVTRVPLRALDAAFGLRLRQRFVDFIARVSPG